MNSGYRILYLLVEGTDDRRFCEEALVPVFKQTYDHVAIWEYSQQNLAKTSDFIRSIGSMNADYILFGDIDERPCVTATKEELAGQFPPLAWDRAVVVRREIEAWYLAGLDEAAYRELGLDPVRDVDAVTKERFDHLVGGRVNHTNAMVNILDRYDLEAARRRSPSFRYFWQKHVRQPLPVL